MATGDAPRRSFLFSFGIDKLGLVALKAPYVSAVLIAILTVLAAFGASGLRVDDSLSELFRTDTKEFRQYEEIDRRFPSSEYDVLIAVDGQNLLTREALKSLQNAVVELQLTDGVGGLVSMLSARSKPDATGYAAPVVPDELPEDGPAFDAMLAELKTNDIVKGKFISEDGQLALIVIALDRQAVEEQTANTIIGGIQAVVDKELAGTGLNAKLTGAPVMQLEIRNAVERDRLIYNGLGFLAGLTVAYLFFRRISLTVITVLGPAIAILWTLGVLGGLDYRLNLFVNVITPLILVSGFSDSMHLVFAIRRDILAGVPRLEAARNAVRDVAPACLLTAMNASLALLSFQFADSALIRTFGQAALLAVAISYIAVAVVVPTLAALLIQPETKTVPDIKEHDTGGVGVLQRMTERIIAFVISMPLLFTALGLGAVGFTGWAYTQLTPMYRLADQVPDKEQALAATAKLDQKLTGANPVHVMIQWKAGTEAQPGIGLYDVSTLSVIARAHDILETEAGLGNVWSLESLRRWLAEAGDARVETIKSYVDILPKHLTRRFIDENESAVLVTARLPDIDSSQILPIVEKIDTALEPLRKENPQFEISVTGLPAIAARNSAKLISEMNWGLVGDIFVIFIFLGIALRSVMAGVSSALPSLFPIFATGALLWATGQGMQFASIMALTVAFSLAIDSTIHFLNRFRLEEDRIGPGPNSAHDALMATAHHIGPAVVLTTIVLALGLGVTMLSHLPSLRLFGELAGICLAASLIGQLIILPATIALFRRYFPLRA
ncbi:MAG: RND transporter [Hyphomicrobium sp. 32-62-53]|nr:MAG: RND transporter [Hyphomicrobium sp. 12-62-95]OYX99087.1 MAG: RND transporter [Hyphomicrobium sp. 32-62-53]